MSNSDLKDRVEALIEEINSTHRYSMSRIYGLYNEAFDKKETPQSCASCLMRKVRELQTWLDNEKKVEEIRETFEPENKENEAEPEKPVKKKRKNGTPKA